MTAFDGISPSCGIIEDAFEVEYVINQRVSLTHRLNGDYHAE
jgi:hypothetical protein